MDADVSNPTTTPPDSTTPTRIGTIQQPHSRLHALPPEIRDIIYEYAIVSPDHIPTINITTTTNTQTAVSSPTPQGRWRRNARTRFTLNNKSLDPVARPPKPRRTHRVFVPRPPLFYVDRSTRDQSSIHLQEFSAQILDRLPRHRHAQTATYAWASGHWNSPARA